MSESKYDKPLARVGFQVSDKSVYDVTGYCAAEMAFNEANRVADFPVKIEMAPIVDERNPELARDAARSYVSDSSAVGVLGPLNSDMALSNQDIYNSAGLAQLTSEASNPMLTAKGYKNFFRLVANDEVQGRALARVACSYLDKRRIAVLHDGSAWGEAIAVIFSNESAILGVPPILFRGFEEGDVDTGYESMVEATLKEDPDLVYFAVYWHKAHIIAHKLRYRGSKATFLGSDALKPYPFLEVPGLDAVKPYHTLAGIDMRIKPSARDFFQRFASKHPLLLIAPQYAAEAYDCASLLVKAIKLSGEPDRQKVLENLRGIDSFQGVIGQISFDERGDLVDPEIGLYQCVNGLRKYLGKVSNLV